MKLRTTAFIVVALAAAAGIYLRLKPVPQSNYNRFDFGSVPAGSELQHDFLLTNESNNTWLVKEVVSSCGCTTAKPEKIQLLPGESTKVPVHVRVKDDDGRFDANVAAVMTSGEVARFFVEGTAIRMLPKAITLTSARPAGEFTFRNLSERTTLVQSVTADSTLVSLKQRSAGRDAKFEIAIAEGLGPGHYKTELVLNTDDPRDPRQVVPADIKVEDFLLLDHDLFSVGVLGDEPKKISFNVSSSRGRSVRILGVNATAGVKTVTDNGTIRAYVSGNMQGLLISETVTIRATDGDVVREFKVQIYGMGKNSHNTG